MNDAVTAIDILGDVWSLWKLPSICRLELNNGSYTERGGVSVTYENKEALSELAKLSKYAGLYCVSEGNLKSETDSQMIACKNDQCLCLARRWHYFPWHDLRKKAFQRLLLLFC